ncbi:MAG: EF-hand domain-containing protein [Zymomonas mobilis subsp. pomaceae]|uniref:EF hand n=2 Tax=Zymomonas mobilis TaxID=542 RepID=F8EU70_ZYMMT|nr:EF-hand domain-containing protein [Zymomonas mobilis]AEI37150.1 EF hand [Zymomonas mobilis subsp. pomaceae ATCC 29192]MDX5948520.1 EF-hand domain-containing protein [Zymomonas mobilis subsp. pomaceae]GEB89828.1 hypothetical protein ZMO02_14650 [Zymomonas mobilis subsp. pomaceae]
MMKKKTFLLNGLSAVSGLLLAASPLSQAFAQDMVPPHFLPITRGEMQARIRQDFDKFDLNHDGTVTTAEFQTALANEKSQCQAMMAQFQKENPDAPKDPDDSSAGKKGRGRRGGHRMCDMEKGPMSHWFDRMDTNHDGQVTYNEASSQALGAYDAVDTNHDGIITPDERKAAFEKWKAEHPFRGPDSKSTTSTSKTR